MKLIMLMTFSDIVRQHIVDAGKATVLSMAWQLIFQHVSLSKLGFGEKSWQCVLEEVLDPWEVNCILPLKSSLSKDMRTLMICWGFDAFKTFVGNFVFDLT